MSIISVFPVHAGGKVALAGLGLVTFDGRGGVRFRLDGDDISVPLPTVGIEENALASIWSDAKSRSVLIHRHQGMVAASIRLPSGEVRLTPVDHDREIEGGLWHSDFIETPRGPLLVYELGVIAFNRDGSVRWRVEHPTIQWVFLGVEGDRVVFDNEFEGQWRYRLEDGQRQVVPSQ
jgi:hypothetical protein